MFDDLEITLTAAEPTAGMNVTIRYNNETQLGAFRLSAVENAIAGLNVALDLGQPPDADLWKSAGGALFDELLSGDLIRLYAQATAPGRQARLRFMSHVPELLRIPWEYLYDRQQERPVALHPDRSLVRSLAVPGRKPVAVDGLLRVLVMLSEPADLPRLDVAGEWRNVENATATAAIELIRIEPTYEALQGALRQHQPHIFHFVGHGRFAETAQQGVLYFQQADGNAVRCPAEQLALLLTGCESLRLALLNACHGATPGNRSAFAGVAQKLIQQGVPAVIAMQAPILDTDALAFSQEFYRALADGYPLEAAVGEGRKRIADRSTAWGVPALYFQGSEPFALPKLDDWQKAARLWSRRERLTADPTWTEALVAQVLQLDPTHAEAQVWQQQARNRAEAQRLYNTAAPLRQQQAWRELHRTLAKVEELAPNLLDTRSQLAEVLGKLPDRTYLPPVAGQRHLIQPLLNALRAGRFVPFLGWDAVRIGRPPADGWVSGQYAPDSDETARELLNRLRLGGATGAVDGALLRTAQIVMLQQGKSILYDLIDELYDAVYPPTILHRLLAELPQRLARRALPKRANWRMVIFSTAIDDLMERAFAAANQPYHCFIYRPPTLVRGAVQEGRFVHLPPGVTDLSSAAELSAPDRKPNAYTDHDRDRQPVLVKLCGLRSTGKADGVILTEDHYLNYLPNNTIFDLLPATLLQQVVDRSFVFFGCSSQEWHFRLLWQRLKYQNSRQHGLSWPILATHDPLETKFWHNLDDEIEPLTIDPVDVAALINEWLEEA